LRPTFGLKMVRRYVTVQGEPDPDTVVTELHSVISLCVEC